jgi:hypothetical protein
MNLLIIAVSPVPTQEFPSADLRNRGDLGHIDFVERNMAIFFVYMIFIDALGLGLDAAIWMAGKDSQALVYAWDLYELCCDFIMVLLLDPLIYVFYIRNIHNAHLFDSIIEDD